MNGPQRGPTPPMPALRDPSPARPPRMGTFTERVMAQVSNEPTPTPARVFMRSLLALRFRDAAAAVATAWHLAFGRTRAIPSLVRVQSLTLLLVLAVVIGSGGTLATAGALRVLDHPAEPTAPAVPVIVVDTSPSPSASPAPSGELAEEPEARAEEAVPASPKRNQAQENGAERGSDRGEREPSRESDQRQKRQPDREPASPAKRDPVRDGSGKSDSQVRQPAPNTPKAGPDERSRSQEDEAEKSGRGS